MKRIPLLCLAVLILIPLGGYGYRKYKQHSLREKTKITVKQGLDTLQYFNVGGTKLAALIRTKDKKNPVLIYVHGGPGIPSMLFARKSDEQLTEDFIMIHFDQRGTGKSYDKQFDTTGLTVGIFVNDLIELTRHIRKQFPDQKLILLGESWGSLISILAICKHPELFDAYVGVGQVADLSNSDQISYDYVRYTSKEQGKKRILKKIKKLDRGNLGDYKQLIKQRRLLDKTGGKFYVKNMRKKMKKYALMSPEYSLCELYRTKKVSKLLGEKLYPEMVSYNFIKKARDIPVPCFFIAGRYDFMVPSMIAENYYFNIQAPYKKFYWFEKSGHASRYEEPEKFAQTMEDIKSMVTASP